MHETKQAGCMPLTIDMLMPDVCPCCELCAYGFGGCGAR